MFLGAFKSSLHIMELNWAAADERVGGSGTSVQPSTAGGQRDGAGEGAQRGGAAGRGHRGHPGLGTAVQSCRGVPSMQPRSSACGDAAAALGQPAGVSYHSTRRLELEGGSSVRSSVGTPV